MESGQDKVTFNWKVACLCLYFDKTGVLDWGYKSGEVMDRVLEGHSLLLGLRPRKLGYECNGPGLKSVSQIKRDEGKQKPRQGIWCTKGLVLIWMLRSAMKGPIGVICEA